MKKSILMAAALTLTAASLMGCQGMTQNQKVGTGVGALAGGGIGAIASGGNVGYTLGGAALGAGAGYLVTRPHH